MRGPRDDDRRGLAARFPLRAAVLALALLVPLASCASKVGDHYPNRITTLDPSLELTSLDVSQVARLCVDVKSILGADRRARYECQVTGLFANADVCRPTYDECMATASDDALGDISDCEELGAKIRGCGRLTVRDYSDCVVGRLHQAAIVADIAPDLCGLSNEAVTQKLGVAYFGADHCKVTRDACADAASLPDL